VKKAAVVVGAVVLGLGLVTGCSWGDSDAPVASAPSVDAQANRVPVEIAPVDIDQWTDRYAAAAAGVTTAHFTMAVDVTDTSTGEALELWDAEGDMDITDPDNPKVTMSLRIHGVSADCIYVDNKTYLKLGVSYVEESDLAEVGDWLGLLDQRSAVGSEVTKISLVGTEKVAGVETNHYVVTYDAARFAALVPDAPGVDTVDVDLWLDDQARTVKFSTTFSADAVVATMEAVFTDYGKVVSVQAPR